MAGVVIPMREQENLMTGNENLMTGNENLMTKPENFTKNNYQLTINHPSKCQTKRVHNKWHTSFSFGEGRDEAIKVHFVMHPVEVAL